MKKKNQTKKNIRNIILCSIGFLMLFFLTLIPGGFRTQAAAADVKVTAANKADGLHFSWGQVAGATYYYIHIIDGKTKDNLAFKTTSPSYIYKEAVNGRSYQYTVNAYNAKRERIGQSAVTKKIIYLSPTSIVSIGENNMGTLTITWKPNAKAARYRIWRSTDGGNSYGSDAYRTIEGNTVTFFKDPDITVGNQYRYRVYAVYGDYHSCASTTKNVIFDHTSDGGTVEVKPTCMAEGRTVFRCKYCRTELETKYPEKLEHIYGNWIELKAPTCREEGLKLRTCTREGCGFAETEPVEKSDHIKIAVNPKAATCTKGGTIEYKCKFCDQPMGSEYIEAKGHTIVKDPAVPATETRNGKTEGSHCSVCGEIIVEQKVIPMKIKVDAVKLLSVTNKGNGVRVQWKKTGNADGWILYRRTGKGNYQKLASIDANGKPEYTDTKVKNGIQYSYQIAAYRTVDGMMKTGTVSGEKTMLRIPETKFLSRKKQDAASVTLSWKKEKNASGYQIRVKSGKQTLKTGNMKKSATSVTIRRLNRGTYRIYIRAYRKKGGKTYYGSWCSKPVVFKYSGK